MKTVLLTALAALTLLSSSTHADPAATDKAPTLKSVPYDLCFVFDDSGGTTYQKTILGVDADGVPMLPVHELTDVFQARLDFQPDKNQIIIHPNAGVATEEDVMTGLDGLKVGIEPFMDTMKADTNLAYHEFSTDGMTSHVEAKLRKAGIPLSGDSTDILYVNISVIRLDQGYSFNILIEVFEPCYSKRTMKAINNARVWERSATGGCPATSTAADFIYSQIDSQLEDLFNDWAKTHPKTETTPSR